MPGQPRVPAREEKWCRNFPREVGWRTVGGAGRSGGVALGETRK